MGGITVAVATPAVPAVDDDRALAELRDKWNPYGYAVRFDAGLWRAWDTGCAAPRRLAAATLRQLDAEIGADWARAGAR